MHMIDCEWRRCLPRRAWLLPALLLLSTAMTAQPGGTNPGSPQEPHAAVSAHRAAASDAQQSVQANGAAAAATSTGTPAGVSASTAATNSAQPSSGAVPGQPTAPKPSTAATLMKLPTPLPPELASGIDADARAKDILAHLDEVIRYYRMSTAVVQKVGEPSDMLYAEQAQSTAVQAAQLAFQSARDEAALLAKLPMHGDLGQPDAPQQQAQRLAASRARTAAQIAALEQQDAALDQQIDKARTAAQRESLQQQLEVVDGQLQLAQAMARALGKVAGVSETQSDNGLMGNIDRLQRSAPELVDGNVKPVTNTLESLASARDAGVTTQAQWLLQLVGTEHAIQQRIDETNRLYKQAVSLRDPLLKILHTTIELGQQAQQQAPVAPAPPANGKTKPSAAAALQAQADAIHATRKRYDTLTTAFNALSEVSIPLSQEMLLLEQSRANLMSWQAAVDAERTSVMRSLLLRVVFIAIALGIIFLVSDSWRRATTRYISDVRRRRQLSVVRRTVIGFLTGIVVLFGFVTQFSSLATFAGFITAGIAVGLQTILLSVAAYFFIIGRYGVRVGDRITVAGVTGDVIDVGLVRFYMMELIGTGTELHPTGRVAVFANSVLFQAGTPLYKQMPGTEYVWHEIAIKLKPDTDYSVATKSVLASVDKVYAGYQQHIVQQHRQVEAWMDTPIEQPRIESRLQLTDGLQFVVLYPVEIRNAADTDQKVVEEVISSIHKDPAVRESVDGAPTVRAVIKT